MKNETKFRYKFKLKHNDKFGRDFKSIEEIRDTYLDDDLELDEAIQRADEFGKYEFSIISMNSRDRISELEIIVSSNNLIRYEGGLGATGNFYDGDELLWLLTILEDIYYYSIYDMKNPLEEVII